MLTFPTKATSLPTLCRLVQPDPPSKPRVQVLDIKGRSAPKLAWLLSSSETNQLIEDAFLLRRAEDQAIFNEFG